MGGWLGGRARLPPSRYSASAYPYSTIPFDAATRICSGETAIFVQIK